MMINMKVNASYYMHGWHKKYNTCICIQLQVSYSLQLQLIAYLKCEEWTGCPFCWNTTKQNIVKFSIRLKKAQGVLFVNLSSYDPEVMQAVLLLYTNNTTQPLHYKTNMFPIRLKRHRGRPGALFMVNMSYYPDSCMKSCTVLQH